MSNYASQPIKETAMTLNEGFFVSETLHEKKVTLPNGEESTLHFRELPAQEFVTFREEQNSDAVAIRTTAAQRLIAKSLRAADGKPVLDDKSALKLTAGGVTVLMTAVMEVNTFNAKKPSPSEVEPGSDTSSP